MEEQTPEGVRRELLDVWNPRGAGSTVGMDHERLVLLPMANRVALVKVNSLAGALLLEDWQAARFLLDGLSQAEARLCALRGSVLAAAAIHEARTEGLDVLGDLGRRWRAAALAFGHEARTATDGSPGDFHEGSGHLLDRCPDLASDRTAILDVISRLLAPLSADAVRGAAFAGAVLLAGALLVSDYRTRRDLAREQLALVTAFTQGDIISFSDGHVRSFD